MQLLLRFFILFSVSAVGTSMLLAQSMRTVALTGQSADSAGGTPMAFAQMGLATINENGEVALLATAQPSGQAVGGGVWSEGGGEGLRLIAFDGREAPGVTGGIYTSLSETYPLINNQGQTAFRSRLAITSGITTLNDTCVWVADAGGVPTLVLREGDSAPGAAPGAVFLDHTDVIGQRFSVFNNLGEVATQTRLRIGTGGVTGNNDFGIWRAGNGPTRMVGVEGAVAAGISPTQYYGNISATPAMNDLGQVTMFAPLKDTPGGTTNTGSGIWLGDPAVGMTLLARNGQTAPGAGGATFASFSRPNLNNASEYAFVGSLTIGGAVTDQNNSAMWISRDGNPMTMLAREADHAPGTGAAVGFSLFENAKINSAGRVTFLAGMAGIPGAGESGITTLNDTGIWSEGGSGLTLVVRENDQAPDLPAGVLFDVLGSPTVNADGRIAFLSDLRGTGVTASNNTALWAQDADGALRLIAREGSTLDVNDGPGADLRTVAQFGFWSDGGGEDGQRTGLNDAGQLVFSAFFTDSTAGVFVVDMNTDLSGDFNNDGAVDAADYVAWRKGVVPTTTPNYNLWRKNFGNSNSGSGQAGASVPEPTTIVLVIFALLTAPQGRRRVAGAERPH
jgi:hypothetical protein